MNGAAARQSRLQSLESIARLLRSRANRYAWVGLGVAAFAIVAATLLSCRYEFDSYSIEGLIAVQAGNPALWALDLMPLIFLIWGQYIGVVMSYQASAMVLDETRELRDEASRLQHELNFRSDGPALGMPNRHALLTAIQRAIDSPSPRGSGFAVLVLTTEHYHELAHGQGDEAAAQYLSQLRERLRSVARNADFLCHFGDDEFGLLLPDSDAAAARRIASRVQLALDLPISIGRSAMTLRAHIGIALFPMHGGDAETLLRRAETAKFAAIGARRDALVYEAQLDDERTERSRLTAELHGALYHDGLGDEYLLQESLQPGRPQRLRLIPHWEHPRRGRLAEAGFLHLADRVGLVHGLSTWLMRESFARLAKWRVQRPELQLVLRLPDAALRELALADLTLRMLQSYELPAQALVLEFSEAALTAAGSAPRQQLELLRKAGIGLCLIGVGAPGASALSSLYYPLDEYRLAAELLERAATERVAREALRLLISVMQTQHLRISFPAISDDARRALLAELRGDYVEALSAPLAMSPAAVERWLAARRKA